MTTIRRSALVSLCLLAGLSLSSAAGAPPEGKLPKGNTTGQMKSYELPYYVMCTDVDFDSAKEAAARMTTMAEEYHNRTRGFAGVLREKLPFYLYCNPEDYSAAGGLAGSSGMFNGKRLMAKFAGPMTWHTVQHEGFHQFAHFVISPRLPVWVDEGLAEYFGEALWTGDGYVTGIILRRRMARVQKLIQDKALLTLPQLLVISLRDWNSAMDIKYYDQAWSLVHFLVHAEKGKYQQAFGGYISDIAGGAGSTAAFTRRFGSDLAGIQKKYCDWWMGLEENPSRRLSVQAVVQTLTSYLARACSEGQMYPTADEFLAAAAENKIRIKDELGWWLPPSLLAGAVKAAKTLGPWSIQKDGRFVKLTLQEPDGTVYVGTFTFRTRKPPEVKVVIQEPAAPAKVKAAGTANFRVTTGE